MERWEFPSLMNPFLAQRRRGIDVRTIAPAGWRAPIDAFAAAIDARTRVVAVSHVSFLTGERHDLEAYAALARRVGALFVVDASHALGSVRVDASVTDVLFGCCYKFLLGVHGVAIACWNRRRVPDWRPALTGWHSTTWRPPFDVPGDPIVPGTGRAFEPGNPAYGALWVLDQSLDYLARFGMDAIEAHTLAMSGELRARLAGLGLDVMTPAPAAERAGSIAFAANDAEVVRARLEDRGVLVSGELGRVRASVHVYTTSTDIAAAAAALADV
jgi:selenocysteine lyase/cysteine desulfurase